LLKAFYLEANYKKNFPQTLNREGNKINQWDQMNELNLSLKKKINIYNTIVSKVALSSNLPKAPINLAYVWDNLKIRLPIMDCMNNWF